jgi:hypothetical protein
LKLKPKPRAVSRRRKPSGLGEAFDTWLATTTIRGDREETIAKATWVMAWNEGRDCAKLQMQKVGQHADLFIEILAHALERANNRIDGLDLLYRGASELNRQYRANIREANDKLLAQSEEIKKLSSNKWPWFRA